MVSIFFELLQIAIGNKTGFSLAPTEGEWRELFVLAQKQALTGIAFLGVERLSKEERPPKELILQWYAATERIKGENEILDKQALMVANRFLRDGFCSVILKGQGIAKLYPKGEYRTPGDIDIWLDGKREDIEKYVKAVVPDCKIVYHHVDFLPIGNTEIEVHFTPSWMNNYITNRRLQKFFHRQRKEMFSRYRDMKGTDGKSAGLDVIPVPTLGFNRVYILVHIYRHLFGEGIGLRQLMDYYYVLCQGFTEEERIETISVLKSLGMERFAAATMYVLQTVFGMEDRFLLLKPDEKEGRFLLDEIMMAGNFGHHDPRIKRVSNESTLHIFCRRVWRNFRFIGSYPSEVIWSPLFKLWHYVWRKSR